MTSKMMHQICYGFYWSIKKWSKLGQKVDFLFILRVFLFMPSYTLWVTPQDFAKWKTLLRYISVVSFISIAFVVVKLKIFKVFRIDSAFMQWPFLRVFGPLLPQILFNLAEILTRCSVPIRKTLCLKNPSNFEFWLKWNSNWVPECNKTVNFGCVNAIKHFCSILGPNLPPKNQKYCLKPKILQKLHP